MGTQAWVISKDDDDDDDDGDGASKNATARLHTENLSGRSTELPPILLHLFFGNAVLEIDRARDEFTPGENIVVARNQIRDADEQCVNRARVGVSNCFEILLMDTTDLSKLDGGFEHS
jgi:hypothetical protein